MNSFVNELVNNVQEYRKFYGFSTQLHLLTFNTAIFVFLCFMSYMHYRLDLRGY